MPRCPNCNYSLVLLEHRSKYKCAKCGRLFFQKEIEVREFQEFNKRQRQEEKEKIKQEISQSKEKQRLSKEENREEYNAKKREYWASNHEHLLAKRRENYNKKKIQILKQQALYRQNHKIERRINALRWEQKEIALRIFKNKFETLCIKS